MKKMFFPENNLLKTTVFTVALYGSKRLFTQIYRYFSARQGEKNILKCFFSDEVSSKK